MATAAARAKAIIDAFTDADTPNPKIKRIVEDYYVGKGQPAQTGTPPVPVPIADQCKFFVTDLRANVLEMLKIVKRMQAVATAAVASDEQVATEIGFPVD